MIISHWRRRLSNWQSKQAVSYRLMTARNVKASCKLYSPENNDKYPYFDLINSYSSRQLLFSPIKLYNVFRFRCTSICLPFVSPSFSLKASQWSDHTLRYLNVQLLVFLSQFLTTIYHECIFYDIFNLKLSFQTAIIFAIYGIGLKVILIEALWIWLHLNASILKFELFLVYWLRMFRLCLFAQGLKIKVGQPSKQLGLHDHQPRNWRKGWHASCTLMRERCPSVCAHRCIYTLLVYIIGTYYDGF